MAEYMFHILKMNVIAAVMIIVALITARLTKRKYSSKWKYHLWLAVMLFLLVPVNFSSKSPVKIQINPMDSKMCGGEYKEKTEQPAQPVFSGGAKEECGRNFFIVFFAISGVEFSGGNLAYGDCELCGFQVLVLLSFPSCYEAVELSSGGHRVFGEIFQSMQSKKHPQTAEAFCM